MREQKVGSSEGESSGDGAHAEPPSSLFAEGERLVRETAGEVKALASLFTSLPFALKDAVVNASHRMFGQHVTAEAAATEPKQVAVAEPNVEAAPLDALHQVMAHAGEHVSDGGGFEYLVGADGTFEIVGAPASATAAIGRKLGHTGKFASAWQTLADKLTGGTAPKKETNAPAVAAPATTGPAVSNAAPTQLGEGATSGENDVKTNVPTVAGDTLAIAKTRAALGEDHTSYLRAFDKTPEGKAAEKQFAVDLASGAKDQDTFYCSGLSIWTLAAAGYEMSTQMKGDDGELIYGEVHREVDVDAKGKPVKDASKAVGKKTVIDKKYVTFKQLIDGDGQAVEIMTRAKGKGGSVGVIAGTGYATERDSDDELGLAARGAAAAFTYAHIGAEVPEAEQKPGDFAQSRRTTKGKDDKGEEEDRGHFGFGHAWQVYSTHVHGAAIFGQAGSPKPITGALSGWRENADFLIDSDTDPALVGAHTTVSAERIEANIGGAMEDKETDGGGAKDKKGKFVGGDGGVQVTGAKKVPDAGLSSYAGYVVFYGRLGTSRWANWTPATAAGAAPAQTDDVKAPAVDVQ